MLIYPIFPSQPIDNATLADLVLHKYQFRKRGGQMIVTEEKMLICLGRSTGVILPRWWIKNIHAAPHDRVEITLHDDDSLQLRYLGKPVEK